MRGVETFLAIKAQTDLFTPQLESALVLGDFLAFNSEGLSGRQVVGTSPEIRNKAMRAISASFNGTVAAEGALEFTASNTNLNKLLSLIFHSKTGTADDVAGTGATYTLTDGGVLTPFTTFVGFKSSVDGTYTRRFTGCKVNRASFSARVDSLLTLGLDVAAINKEIRTETATPLYAGSGVEYGYVFSDAKVQILAGDMSALGEVPVESFDVSIDHQLSTDRYRLGSLYRRSLQEGVTEVTGSFTLDAAAKALSGQKLNTAGGGTDDPAFFEKIAREGRYAELQFTVTDNTRHVDVGDTIPCSLTLSLPFCRLEEPDFNIRDAGIITGSSRFTAYDSIEVVHVATLS